MTEDPGRMWMRMRHGPLTRAAVTFLADVVPSGVVRAAGRTGAGTSLDNSMRFGIEPQGDWMLVDVDPYLISDGYVHGAGRVWSEGGALLGVASQTASVLLFD
jgi:acyl-CoA thioesterase